MRRRDQRIVPTRYDRMLWQTVKQGNLRLTLRLVLYGNNEGPASFPIVLGVDSITVPVRVPCSIDEPIPGRDGLFDFISHDPGFSFPPASVLRQKFCTMQTAARGADFEPGWAVLKIACGVQFQSRERFRWTFAREYGTLLWRGARVPSPSRTPCQPPPRCS